MAEKRINEVTKEVELSDISVSVRVFWIFAFALLAAIGAQIEIPNQPVPFTLQTLFVLLAGPLLGKKSGAASMGLYVILGTAGLPVFSGAGFGIARIFGPTGGYLLSFPVAAFTIGYLAGIRREYWWTVISMIIGSLLILCIGTIQLNFVYIHNWQQAFQTGFFIFSLWDAVKIIGAATIVHYYFRTMSFNKNQSN